MLTELCKELNNWFCKRKYFDTYSISDGTIIVPELKNGQHFRIVGSTFNDGVYQYPAQGLQDETFDGAVWAMAIPAEVIALSAEIDEWKKKYAGIDSVAMSPFQSESFGGYSYSKADGAGDSGNTAGDWRSVFSSRLNNWRRIGVL